MTIKKFQDGGLADIKNFHRIDHAFLLTNRIQNENDNNNIDNALYLVDVFIELYPDNFEAKKKLVCSCLSMSVRLLQNIKPKDIRVDKAISFISKALQLNNAI